MSETWRVSAAAIVWVLMATFEVTPSQSLAAAVATLSAGDTLYLRSGVYGGSNATIDSQTNTVASGTSFANAVTIAGYPGEVAIIQPPFGVSPVRLTTGGAPHYIIIQDLVLDQIHSASIGSGSSADGIYLSSGAHHNRFQRLEIKNNGGNGIQFSNSGGNSPNNEVLDCRIHHNGQQPGVNHGYGIYCFTSNNLIAGNEIYSNGGYGLHLYNNSGPLDVAGNVVTRNRVHHNGTHGGTNYGMAIAWGSGNLITNNLFYANQGGILVYTNCSNTGIYNNTITNNSPFQGISLQFHGSGVAVRNNIIYANTTDIDDIEGTATITDNTSSDPLFENATAANFHLTALSAAAINLGATIAAVPNDYDGGARPFGPAYDIGAYEFGAEPDTTPDNDPDPGGPTGPIGGGPAVPALVFTGYGDSTTMRFLSVTGADQGQPPSTPVPGVGVDGIVTMTVTGRVGIIGGSGPNFPNTGVGIFNPDFTVRAEGAIIGGPIPDGIAGRSSARDDAGYFYGGGREGADGWIYRYDSDGAAVRYGPILVLTPATVFIGVQTLAVNGAGTIAYFGELTDTGMSNLRVRMWDLVGDTDLGVLVTESSPYQLTHNSLLALSNGDLLVGWRATGGASGRIDHYSSGTIIDTYAMPSGSSVDPVALTYGLTDATFWVNYYDGDLATFSGVTVAEIELGTGTVLHSFAPDDGSFEFDSPFCLATFPARTQIIVTTIPCICDHTPTDPDDSDGPVTNPGTITDPVSPDWTRSCTDGGGDVPTVADLTDSEDWDT